MRWLMDGWLAGIHASWLVCTSRTRSSTKHSHFHTSTHPHHTTPPLAACSVTFFLKRQRPSHVACSGWVLGAGLSAAMTLSKLTGAESLGVWLMRHLARGLRLAGDGGLQWVRSGHLLGLPPGLMGLVRLSRAAKSALVPLRLSRA